MSTPDHSYGPPPGRVPAPLPAPAYLPAVPAAWDDPGAAAAPEPAAPSAGRRLNLRTVLRAVRRHWWQILLIWGVASAALMALAYTRVKPRYDAFSLIQVEPPAAQIFGPNGTTLANNPQNQMETQVRLVTSPDVLGTALQDPKVAALPRVALSLDPETELRDVLRVNILGRTSIIEVAMTSTMPNEPVWIVNAVVDAYIDYTKTFMASRYADQRRQLQELEKDLSDKVDARQDKLRMLFSKGNAIPLGAVGAKPAAGDDGEGRQGQPSAPGVDVDAMRNQVSIEEYRSRTRELTALEAELFAAENEAARLRSRRTGAAEIQKAELDEEVRQAIETDPDVQRVRQQYGGAKASYDRAVALTRKRSDPSRASALQRLTDLQAEYKGLVQQKEPAIRRRVMAAAAAGARDDGEQAIREAEALVEQLRARHEFLDGKLKELKLEAKVAGTDALEVQFTQIELARSQANLDKVSSMLSQLEYEVGRDQTLVARISAARVSFLPTSDNRLKLMAAAPLAVLAAVLGLFVLVEARAGRVADADELSGRVRVEVIGTVPPLPSARGLLGRSPARLQRRVDEYVQSLDHLRVALCAGGRSGAPGGGPGRKVMLITSACGSEGKTTLAAQLAGRCANAGLSTLLVDGDLRRPRLGELLEVPEGPGLADVLAGDIAPEAAMVVIGNAGGFHLLPAGSIGHDPSRLLQSERLGQLIAQMRASFDVVIIDAPPVLAVPDALLIGRWTDGAVLAVRHDASRYPLVERANRRLATIGVPVLGAVVNGVRPADAAYSNYSYSYAYSGGGNGNAGGAGPAAAGPPADLG